MATAHSPNDLTRQQLDELDALLQKMLALPLSPTDGAAPVASSPAASRATVSELPLPEMASSPLRSASPLPYTPSIPTPFPASSNREMAPPVVWRGDSPSGPTPSPQLLAILTPSDPTPAPATRKAPSSHSRPVEPGTPPTPPTSKGDGPSPSTLPRVLTTPVPVPSSMPVSPSQPVPAKTEPVPAILAPLVAFNLAVNVSLGQLGLAGRIFRSGFAKNLLALAGLGLLVYTAAKVALTQGWVAFPFTLPWPT
ncbi:MAG TPA: hypothetical protein VG122_17335 [Gemmata sp.]|jgi:hypothetical protein|nr:hypothetical protein [Gemmata sp.]